MYPIIGFIALTGSILALLFIIIRAIRKRPKVKLSLIFILCFAISQTSDDKNETSTKIATSTPTATLKTTATPALTDSPVITDGFISTEVPNKTETKAPTATPETIATLIPPTDPPLSFMINGNHEKYGKEVVLNKGSEFEEVEITYYIPSGTYLVTNLNEKESVQISVYSGGPEYDGEWQYFVTDENCAKPIVLFAGDTKELEIKDGQFIVLSDGSNSLQFVQERN